MNVRFEENEASGILFLYIDDLEIKFDKECLKRIINEPVKNGYACLRKLSDSDEWNDEQKLALTKDIGKIHRIAKQYVAVDYQQLRNQIECSVQTTRISLDELLKILDPSLKDQPWWGFVGQGVVGEALKDSKEVSIEYEEGKMYIKGKHYTDPSIGAKTTKKKT